MNPVCNVALPNSINEITHCAAENQTQAHAHEPLARGQARCSAGNDAADYNRRDAKQQATVLQQAERRAKILRVQNLKPVPDQRNGRCEDWQRGLNHALAKLIKRKRNKSDQKEPHVGAAQQRGSFCLLRVAR